MQAGSSASSSACGGDVTQWLERGRESYGCSAWEDAYDALSRADSLVSLGEEDLRLLVWSAALTARDSEMLAALERVYRLQIAARDSTGAARSAFWLGYRLSFLGELGRATAWLGRARDLVEALGGDSAERGYLL